MVQLMSVPPRLILASLKSRMMLPFWYWLTQGKRGHWLGVMSCSSPKQNQAWYWTSKTNKSWLTPTDCAVRCVTRSHPVVIVLYTKPDAVCEGDGRQSTADNTWQRSMCCHKIIVSSEDGEKLQRELHLLLETFICRLGLDGQHTHTTILRPSWILSGTSTTTTREHLACKNPIPLMVGCLNEKVPEWNQTGNHITECFSKSSQTIWKSQQFGGLSQRPHINS